MSEQVREAPAERRRFTRRRSDARALEVLESIPDGIYALDREWRYTYVNESALLRLRRMKDEQLTREDLLGRNLWEIFPERVGSVFYQKLHEAVRQGKTLEFEAHITFPDKWIAVRVYPSEHGVSVYYRDITEAKRAKEERELLLRRAITAHEEERLRISREIHDELGQQVSALRLQLTPLKRHCAGQPALEGEIDRIDKLLRKLDSDLDLLVWNLRPVALDAVGFNEALANLVAQLPKHAGIHAELQFIGLKDAPLPPEVEIVVYRVVQEALNNVVKHAMARNVYVVLKRQAGQVVVIVEDDGKGIDSDRLIDDGRGAGLIGVRERAATLGGTFEFESHPGRGTTVAVRIPLAAVST